MRKQRIDVNKYEKSFDNHCAALVSRKRRAPRAGQDRKPWLANELRLMSLLIMARGAQVSRAARGLARVVRAFYRSAANAHAAANRCPKRKGRATACKQGSLNARRHGFRARGVAGATPSSCGTSNITICPECHTMSHALAAGRNS